MCESMLPGMYNFFFFNDTATTEIYTLSLHDALPISALQRDFGAARTINVAGRRFPLSDDLLFCTKTGKVTTLPAHRSEEHTSELQSRQYLVCRLLLEKKKTITLAYIFLID